MSGSESDGELRRNGETDGHHVRQKKLTEDFPVVKNVRVGSSEKSLVGKKRKAVGAADVTAGGSSGTSGGAKRVKQTPKRNGDVSEAGGDIKGNGGRLMHFVRSKDTVHYQYEEASEGNQRKARNAMDECPTAYPSVKMVMSKSHVDSGFWLVSAGDKSL